MLTAGGHLVHCGLVHREAARRLVHHLKYRGLLTAAAVLAEPMARALGGRATVLIPVPRATARRLRYGVDPADSLATAVGRLTGIPVARLLRPGLWWPRHAPRAPAERVAPLFVARGPAPVGAVLVDDVVRTGSTVEAAMRSLGGGDLSGLVASAPGTLATQTWRPPGRLASGDTAQTVVHL